MGLQSGYTTLLERAALPLVSRFTSSRFYDLYRSYTGRGSGELWAPAPEQTIQRLRDLAAHATAHVPYYRDRYHAAGLSADDLTDLDSLRRFPPLTKADILANFPDLITSREKIHPPWRYVSTSGTIQRLTAIHDFRKRDMVRATQLIALTTATGYRPGMPYMEIPPDICRDVCGQNANVEPPLGRYLLQSLLNRSVLQPEVQSNIRGLLERQALYRVIQLPSYWSSNMIQEPQITRLCLASIAAHRPHVLKALPVYLYLMALDILDHKMEPPHVPFIMPMGSSLSRHMHQVIQDAFQSQIREDYGSAELGGMASECRHHMGLHPMSGLFHLELLRDGQPVPPGQPGSVFVTDLFSYAMPVIRYQIGDVGVLRTGRCGCGLETPRLEILGREPDSITTGDGTLHPADSLVDAVLAVPGVRLFQAEVRGRRIYVSVAPRHGAVPALEDVFAALRGVLGPEYRFDGQLVTDLIPENGGKFRFIKGIASLRAAG